jgi:hypothetical protein
MPPNPEDTRSRCELIGLEEVRAESFRVMTERFRGGEG